MCSSSGSRARSQQAPRSPVSVSMWSAPREAFHHGAVRLMCSIVLLISRAAPPEGMYWPKRCERKPIESWLGLGLGLGLGLP